MAPLSATTTPSSSITGDFPSGCTSRSSFGARWSGPRAYVLMVYGTSSSSCSRNFVSDASDSEIKTKAADKEPQDPLGARVVKMVDDEHIQEWMPSWGHGRRLCACISNLEA
jgi:hypothetical protein